MGKGQIILTSNFSKISYGVFDAGSSVQLFSLQFPVSVKVVMGIETFKKNGMSGRSSLS